MKISNKKKKTEGFDLDFLCKFIVFKAEVLVS